MERQYLDLALPGESWDWKDGEERRKITADKPRNIDIILSEPITILNS